MTRISPFPILVYLMLFTAIASGFGSGNCLDFDGDMDFVAGSGLTTFMEHITLEAWIYHRSLPSSVQRYVSVEGSTTDIAVIRHDGGNQQGQLHFYIKTDGAHRHIRVNNALQTGKWYHVAGTWDGTTQRLYLNGEEVGASTPGGGLNSPNGSLEISYDPETMDGYIDEVRIWKDARSPDEIRSNMYGTLSGSETDLAGYWRLDETSGNDAQDSAGSIELHLFGMTDDDWVTSGAFSGPRNALEFDGSDDYVSIPSSTSLDNGQFTTEFWTKLSNPGDWDGIIDKGRSSDTDWYFLTRTSTEGEGVVFGIGTGSSRVELSYSWGDTLWHHVAGTCDGTTMRLYVDGVERGSAAATMSVTTNAIVFGNRSSGAGWCFRGSLDDVRIWDHTRTPGEIRDHMCTTVEGDEGGLAGYWRFDQEVGTTLYDWSSNGNDGTLVNMTDDDWMSGGAFVTWVGCAGTDWATGDNWSVGQVPDFTFMNVGIPAHIGGNEPEISGNYACGHLVIDSGATFTTATGALLTVNGNALAAGTHTGDGALELTGASASHAIAGTFGNLELDETEGAEMADTVTVNGTLTLTNGDLDLNGYTLTLGSNALLSETAGNTVTGASGMISTIRTFTAGDLSAGMNIAGMGAEITTDTGLGLTVVTRGHEAQNTATSTSILRYFDITPSINTGLDATLVFHYDDSELNGLAESGLGLGRSTDSGGTWAEEGGTVDIENETIALSGIDALSRWSAFEIGLNPAGSLTGVKYCDVDWGDYDNDGDLDIFLAGYTGNALISRVYRNDGTDTFTHVSSLTGVSSCSNAWGDYDNDGDLDILMVGGAGENYYARIYRNDGSDVFTHTVSLPGVSLCDVAWGDYDNDGDLDILISGSNAASFITRIYRNDGSDTFIELDAGLPGVQSGGVAWGDYDNDGDLDILMTGATSGGRIARIYRNDNSSGFTQTASFIGVSSSRVAWGDYDSDGDLDFILAGWTGGQRITRVYRNDGSDTFTDIGAGLAGTLQCALAWGDCDNDGDLDILMAGTTYGDPITRIYRNDGSDVFTHTTSFTGVEQCGAAWGDYDADGDLDMVISGDTGSDNITRIYRRDTFGFNALPNPPSNLLAVAVDDSVTLSWSKGIDTETQRDGLTSNLRIGSSSGGVEIISPMADVVSGLRRIPALGNAGHDTTWVIRNLSYGWHYWSVQSIDNNLSGSSFAPVDSFFCDFENMTLTCTVRLDTLDLEWNTEPSAASYWIYGTYNQPNFVPQIESPFEYRVATTVDTTWSSPAGIADPDTNWTYQVIAVDGSENEIGRSNRVGEHEFMIP